MAGNLASESCGLVAERLALFSITVLLVFSLRLDTKLLVATPSSFLLGPSSSVVETRHKPEGGFSKGARIAMGLAVFVACLILLFLGRLITKKRRKK